MIIGFWSEKAGRGSCTYNMLATGLAMAERSREKVVLMQGKKDYNRIEYAFIPYENNEFFKEDYGYYNYGGIDSVITKIENETMTSQELMKELIRVNKTNIFYLPSTREGDEKRFLQAFERIKLKYLEFFKSQKEIVLLELGSGYESINQEVEDRLDMLVINISQVDSSLEKILNRRELKTKTMILVGSYDDNSKFSVGNIRHKNNISETNIGAIPYNTRFRDAVCSGRSQEFYERHKNSEKNDSEYFFIQSIESAADSIMKICRIE